MDAAPLLPAEHTQPLDPARLFPLLDAAGIGVLSGAWPGRSLACSAVARAHFGLSAEDVSEFDDLLACIHPQDASRLEQAVAQSMEAVRAGEFTCRLSRVGTAEAWVSIAWQVRRDASGAPCGWDGITRDISATRQAQAERDAAQADADRRASALSQVYEREHRIAEALQRSLLIRPSLEALGGLQVETVYQAAWDEALVGGDYYDVFGLEDGKLALVVGDVSGKGLEAASRTAEIKFTLRAYLREYPHAATAMERLNAFLCEARVLETSSDGYFVCLTLAVVSPVSGVVEICAAGAEPSFLLRAGGETEMLREGGLPLGVAAKAEYTSLTVTQEVGDVLLIITDGLTEARQGAQFLGDDGAVSLARASLAAGTLAEAGQAILAGAQAFAGGPLHDDVCLLLARRTA